MRQIAWCQGGRVSLAGSCEIHQVPLCLPALLGAAAGSASNKSFDLVCIIAVCASDNSMPKGFILLRYWSATQASGQVLPSHFFPAPLILTGSMKFL
jgi:hypothetical protein